MGERRGRPVHRSSSPSRETAQASQSALVRGAMNLVPACLYLALGRRFSMQAGEARLWFLFSIVSVALAVAAIVSPSTTAVDRIALYMLPLQLVVPLFLGVRWNSRPTRAIRSLVRQHWHLPRQHPH